MVAKKVSAEKNQEIQKEQTQLLQVQKELEAVLSKVNEAVNALKVEELQLKASAVSAMKISKPQSTPELEIANQPSATVERNVYSDLACLDFINTQDMHQLCDEDINRQDIDLQMLLTKSQLAEEEEEEEESD